MRNLLLLTFCGLALWPSTVQAQPAGKRRASLTVIPLPLKEISPQRADQVLALLAVELRRMYQVSVLGGRAVGRAVWGALDDFPALQAVAAQKFVDEAFQAYKTLELDKASRLLDQAEKALEFGGAEIGSPETPRKLHFTRGLVALGLGRQAEAMASFGLAVACDPSFVPPRDKFAPRIIKVFQNVRKAALATAPGRMQVLSNPGGAEVFLDGRSRGITPLALEVPPGRHFLRLELADHSAWTLHLPDGPCPAEIRARMVPQWTADPPSDLLKKAVADEPLEEAQVAVLRLLAGFFRADAVVLASVSEQGGNVYLGVRLFTVRPESVGKARLFNLGQEAERFQSKIGGVATTLEGLKALRPVAAAEPEPSAFSRPVFDTSPAPAGPAGPVEPVPREPVEPAENGQTRWYKSWWFWTAIGVAVAGAAAGTAIWLTRPEASWTLVVRPR